MNLYTEDWNLSCKLSPVWSWNESLSVTAFHWFKPTGRLGWLIGSFFSQAIVQGQIENVRYYCTVLCVCLCLRMSHSMRRWWHNMWPFFQYKLLAECPSPGHIIAVFPSPLAKLSHGDIHIGKASALSTASTALHCTYERVNILQTAWRSFSCEVVSDTR